MPPQVFFGYPSRPPMRRATIREAAEALRQTGEIDARTWEELSVTGRLIISEITAAIDRSVVSVFDVTEVNENVLFEVGYAVGSDRSIWLLRDTSFAASTRRWEKFGLFRPIGYSGYTNSDEIVRAFLREQPHHRSSTILSQLTDPNLSGITSTSVFYIASPHDTNAERAIRRTLERERSSAFTLATADPTETASQPLAWYADSISASRGVVAHFTAPGRQDAEIHNARAALLSGLAVGMGRPLLMLAEDDYSTPIDYQDALYIYSIPRDAVGRVNTWLRDQRSALASAPTERPSQAFQSALKLRSLRLGFHVAEDEASTLSDYFVETRPYIDVLDGGVRLFVGRKGTGKTAVMLRAADELSTDARNVVCTIKPPGYELESLLRLLRGYREKDTKGYVIESIWKFLLFSELAKAAVDHIRRQRLVVTPGSPEWELLETVDNSGDLVTGDFAVRLERAVNELLPIDVGTGVAVGRLAISEAMHETLLRDLREKLGRALSGRHRVAILVDNLDKAWDRDADIPELSQFLLGLLGAMRPLASEFQRRETGRQPVTTSLAVFLRSDIYGHVSRSAREPDKLAVSRLDWTDPELLIRVLEERYAVAQGVSGSEIWTRLFCSDVDGRRTRDWLLGAVLPRPRDLLYLANAAITNAVNRRHNRVESSDLRDARNSYSTYAVESVLVEGEQDMPQLDNVLYEFAGAPVVIEGEEALKRIRSGLPKRHAAAAAADALTYLLQLSFLGVETRPGNPTFADNPQDLTRALAIAQSRADGGPLRYHVHPAFAPYLDIAT